MDSQFTKLTAFLAGAFACALAFAAESVDGTDYTNFGLVGSDWKKCQFAFNEERQCKERKTWYGAQEVAFARHTDPVQPLLYTVPTDVHMRIDADGLTDAQMKKNREEQLCLIDCGAKASADKK